MKVHLTWIGVAALTAAAIDVVPAPARSTRRIVRSSSRCRR